MTTNPYFKLYGKQGNENEQKLIKELAKEAIQIYGIDVYYIPRTQVNEDKILNEDTSSAFNKYYVIEGYVENYEGFDGENEVMLQFGLQVKDQISILFQQERFIEVVGERPKEGDLIYFPLSNDLFEIIFVEREKAFYPSGILPYFQVKCQLYEYSSGETFNTGISEVDAIDDVIQTPAGNFTRQGAIIERNEILDLESKNIIDHTQKNPRGMP